MLGESRSNALHDTPSTGWKLMRKDVQVFVLNLASGNSNLGVLFTGFLLVPICLSPRRGRNVIGSRGRGRGTNANPKIIKLLRAFYL